jgi:hypothetical protein
MSGKLLSDALYDQLGHTVRRVRTMDRRLDEASRSIAQGAGSSFRTRSAKLLTDLDAVDDPFGEPSTGRAVLYQRAEDGTLTPTLDSQGEDMEVDVEWRLDFSLEANQYVQLEHINGAWSPYVSSCSPVEGSSAS